MTGKAVRFAVLLLLAAACGGEGPRREYPRAMFSPPLDTVLTRYVNVPVAAWLGGSRWAVVAAEFDEAIVADLGNRSFAVLGGEGEHRLGNPSSVYSFSDTAYVSDWVRRAVTIWDSDRGFLGLIPAPDALRGVLPRARDGAGRLYYEVAPPPGPDPSSQDSAAVVHSDPGRTRFDTLARLTPPDVAPIEDEAGRRLQRRIFGGADEWGVVPDGSVWLARVNHNRVDWISPEGITRGEPLPDRIYEVTSTDLEHWLLQFPEELRSTARQLPWAPFKPPFTEGLTAADGSVWLEKSRAVSDTVRSYHVVDRQGRLLYIAVLPIRQGHVIAVGDTVALLAEQYAEGVRLMQVAVPRP